MDAISVWANALSIPCIQLFAILFVYSIEHEGNHYSFFDTSLRWRSEWSWLLSIFCWLCCCSAWTEDGRRGAKCWVRWWIECLRLSSIDPLVSSEKEVKYCSKATKTNLGSSCLDKNLEYPISPEDLSALEKERLSVNTQPCPSNPKLKCLSTDQQSLIGAGTYGLVVRGRSKAVPFPLAIKFIKLPAKLDLVSFNTQGRYNRIDVDSLKKNQGSQTRLREAVALRLLTDYETPSVPKYVTDLDTSSYRILAMELLQGYDELSKIIDKLSSKELLVVSCQVAAIVCNLDRLGLAHDDMHERNILLARGNVNQVYLIDFGGAQFQGHLSSAGNFLKQPINLLGHLKRLAKDGLIDHIQSEEKKSSGSLCRQMENAVGNDKEAVAFDYRLLFDKYWKISQTKKKLFKCTLTK